MQDRLSKLVAIFEGLDLSANRAEGDDLLGDAYEYLMRHFATESGKSKGQFYTPAEVSRVMAKVIGIGPKTRPDQTIYDPTCGSGALLLKAADHAHRAPDQDAGGRGQVVRQHPDHHRGRGAEAHSTTRRAREGAGRALRPPATGAGAEGGGVQREGRGALESDGTIAMSRRFDFENLVELCLRAHADTRRSAVRAVDASLVARNWLFGWYIVEFENGGADRSELYGKQLIMRLSDKLKAAGLKGCSPTNLRKFREFYRGYPEIQQTVPVESAGATEIRRTLSIHIRHHRAAPLPPTRLSASGFFSVGPTTSPS